MLNETRLRSAGATFLRYPSPWILGLTAATALALRLSLGSFGPWDVVVSLAIVAVWPILEWLIHVFILHARPLRIGRRCFHSLTARKHLAHHLDPSRASDVFIPIHTYAFTIPGLALFWMAAMPTAALASTGFATTFLLALHYEWIHFLVHTRYRPRTRLYRRMKRHHRLHHFKNEHYWLGVTTRLGDRLLRTLPTADAVETSSTCRTLANNDRHQGEAESGTARGIGP